MAWLWKAGGLVRFAGLGGSRRGRRREVARGGTNSPTTTVNTSTALLTARHRRWVGRHAVTGRASVLATLVGDPK